MNRIRCTTLAVDELKTISYRIERERDLATANRVCRAIYEAIQILRRYTFIGRVGEAEGARTLVALQMPYVVVYGVMEADTIQILTPQIFQKTNK